MPKPSFFEHSQQIRALLDAMSSAAVYEDTEIWWALQTALSLVPEYITRTAQVAVTAGSTAIELADHCPAESVTEVVPPGNQAPITEFRARGTQLILRTAIANNGNATVVFRAAPRVGPGDTVDWYDNRYRGPVCMYAAGLLMLGRSASLAETDPAKAAQLIFAAQTLMRDAATALGIPRVK